MKESIYFLFLLLMVLCSCDQEEEPIVVDDPNVKTYASVKSIIDVNCTGCHSVGGNAESSGVYTSYSDLKLALDNSAQEFIYRISSTDPFYRMPPPQSLTTLEIEKLTNWINNDYPQ